MKRNLCALLILLISIFLISCEKETKEPKTNENKTTTDNRKVDVSNKKLWEAESNVVVIKDNESELVEFALNEFEDIFSEATELKLTSLFESEVTVEEDNFYYFIGQTDALFQNDIDVSYKKLGDSGVVIKTIDNCVYMSGATDKGTLYSVYEFLNRSFDYEYYAEDEIYIGDGTDADWLIFDYEYKPSISNPCVMAGELNKNEELYYRYRFQNYYDTWMRDNDDVYYAHTYFKILPKSIYESTHPDFYSPDGMNLCLTRDPMIVDEFVKRCKEVLSIDKEHTYFMLGQEDNFEFCHCASCENRKAELGGFSSAVMMEFTNKVVKELNEWLKEEDPTRNVIFVTFAYNDTKTPPVTYNESTKNYEPIDDSLIAEDNLSVQFVINMCDYYAPYTANKNIVNALEGWSALSKNLTIWEYSTNFDNYMDCFDNWNSFNKNLDWLSSYGVNYIVEQSAYNTNTSAFSEMRLYCMSKLMWDSSLNMNELVDNFMFYYYQDAYEDVKNYFEAIYSHVDELVKEKGISVRSGGTECMVKQNWSYTLLSSIKEKIVNAYNEIEKYKNTNTKKYNTLYSRIEKQELWVDYYIYKFYPIYIGDNTAQATYYNEWKTRARKYGLSMIREGEYL